jgi:hypothetical protein
MTISTETVLIALPEQTVALLMEMRRSSDEKLSDVVDRLAQRDHEPPIMKPIENAVRPRSGRRQSGHGPYYLSIFGNRKSVPSLADGLAYALNSLADLDLKLLYRLENTGGRTRPTVAQAQNAVHPGRPDLNQNYTKEFRPGWWMSTNYSFQDIRRILAMISRETGLTFGEDIDIVKQI